MCIVTGAARGIGRGIVNEMAKRGARVVLNDIDPEPLAAAVDELTSQGADVVGAAADVSTVEGGESLTQAALDRWGRADVLVNNAGVTKDALFHKMTEAQWDQIHGIHTRALFTCTQPLVRHIIERRKVDPSERGGSVICMSSTSGLMGNLGQTNYASAKSAVLGFVLALAKEMKRHDTRVNAIAPSAWTRLLSETPEEVLRKHMGDEKLKQMQANRPEHIGAVVCFLASRSAEGVTGQFVRSIGKRVGVFSHPHPKVSAGVDGDADWDADDVAEAFAGFAGSLESLSSLGDV